jgi:hypothetical protein
MTQNIKPRLHFQNNTHIVCVMTRYHLQWQCLCLFYLNTDNELVTVTLNKETVVPVKVCSADYFINQTRPKTDLEALTSVELERFKSRVSITNYSVRFVHKLAKLLGD